MDRSPTPKWSLGEAYHFAEAAYSCSSTSGVEGAKSSDRVRTYFSSSPEAQAVGSQYSEIVHSSQDFVFMKRKDSKVIDVGVRGSESPFSANGQRDWGNNLQSALEKVTAGAVARGPQGAVLGLAAAFAESDLTQTRRFETLKENFEKIREQYPDHGFRVVGHSLGGATTVGLGLLFPDVRVVALNPGGSAPASLRNKGACPRNIDIYVVTEDPIAAQYRAALPEDFVNVVPRSVDGLLGAHSVKNFVSEGSLPANGSMSNLPQKANDLHVVETETTKNGLFFNSHTIELDFFRDGNLVSTVPAEVVLQPSVHVQSAIDAATHTTLLSSLDALVSPGPAWNKAKDVLLTSGVAGCEAFVNSALKEKLTDQLLQSGVENAEVASAMASAALLGLSEQLLGGKGVNVEAATVDALNAGLAAAGCPLNLRHKKQTMQNEGSTLHANTWSLNAGVEDLPLASAGVFKETMHQRKQTDNGETATDASGVGVHGSIGPLHAAIGLYKGERQSKSRRVENGIVVDSAVHEKFVGQVLVRGGVRARGSATSVLPALWSKKEERWSRYDPSGNPLETIGEAHPTDVPPPNEPQRHSVQQFVMGETGGQDTKDRIFGLFTSHKQVPKVEHILQQTTQDSLKVSTDSETGHRTSVYHRTDEVLRQEHVREENGAKWNYCGIVSRREPTKHARGDKVIRNELVQSKEQQRTNIEATDVNKPLAQRNLDCGGKEIDLVHVENDVTKIDYVKGTKQREIDRATGGVQLRTPQVHSETVMENFGMFGRRYEEVTQTQRSYVDTSSSSTATSLDGFPVTMAQESGTTRTYGDETNNVLATQHTRWNPLWEKRTTVYRAKTKIRPATFSKDAVDSSSSKEQVTPQDGTKNALQRKTTIRPQFALKAAAGGTLSECTRQVLNAVVHGENLELRKIALAAGSGAISSVVERFATAACGKLNSDTKECVSEALLQNETNLAVGAGLAAAAMELLTNKDDVQTKAAKVATRGVQGGVTATVLSRGAASLATAVEKVGTAATAAQKLKAVSGTALKTGCKVGAVAVAAEGICAALDYKNKKIDGIEATGRVLVGAASVAASTAGSIAVATALAGSASLVVFAAPIIASAALSWGVSCVLTSAWRWCFGGDTKSRQRAALEKELGFPPNVTKQEAERIIRRASLKCHPDKGFSAEDFKQLRDQYEKYCKLRDDWNAKEEFTFMENLRKTLNTLLGAFRLQQTVRQIEGGTWYIATVRVVEREADAKNLVRHIADSADAELVHDINHGVPLPKLFLDAVYTQKREEAATSLQFSWKTSNLTVTSTTVAGQSPLVSLQLVRGVQRSMYDEIVKAFVSTDLNQDRNAASSLFLLGWRH